MVPLRALPAMVVLGSAVALVTLITVPASVGCRSKPTAEVDGSVAPAASGEEPNGSASEPVAEGTIGDAGNRFRDAEPKVEVDPDGPIDAACSGEEVAFATAVVDRRCAIGSSRAKQLRANLERDGGAGAQPLTLRQDAKLAADGRVVLRLVNTGTLPLTLPLSFSSKLPAFTVLAEDERHSIYELEAPRFEVGVAGAGDAAAANERPHFARIILPPGGAAIATIAIMPSVVRVLGRGSGAEKCDGGPCVPARLGKGRYVLHIGELLTDVEAGAPARVTWDLP